MNGNKKVFIITKRFKISKENELPNDLTKKIEWTKEEDNLLQSLSNTVNVRKRWLLFEKYFPDKNSTDLYCRFNKINKNIKKGKWTNEENFKIKRLVNDYGYNWPLISKILKNRNCKQIRSHYLNYLREGLEVQKPFSQNEDENIFELHKLLNNNWSKYEEFLPSRSAKMIENRYKSLLRKKNNNKSINIYIDKYKQNYFNKYNELAITDEKRPEIVNESQKIFKYLKINKIIDDCEFISVLVPIKDPRLLNF